MVSVLFPIFLCHQVKLNFVFFKAFENWQKSLEEFGPNCIPSPASTPLIKLKLWVNKLLPFSRKALFCFKSLVILPYTRQKVCNQSVKNRQHSLFFNTLLMFSRSYLQELKLQLPQTNNNSVLDLNISLQHGAFVTSIINTPNNRQIHQILMVLCFFYRFQK